MEKRYSFTKKELIEIYQTAKKGLWPDKLGEPPECFTIRTKNRSHKKKLEFQKEFFLFRIRNSIAVVVPRCELDPDCKTLGANQIEFEVLPDESENG